MNVIGRGVRRKREMKVAEETDGHEKRRGCLAKEAYESKKSLKQARRQ